MNTDMTEPERLAEQWHDTRYDVRDQRHSSCCYSPCWCCCDDCQHANPHYDAAKAAIKAEMGATQ